MTKKFLAIIIFSFFTSYFAVCQKLPNIQATSMNVPKNIKVDGKFNEWGNTAAAYNHSTDVFYTVANDSKYIYFVVQATDIGIVKKIIKGGITISINPVDKKFDSNCKSITFPKIKTSDEGILNKIIADGANEKDNALTTDSVVRVYNNTLSAASTEIKIGDINMLRDSTVSIYNTLGIQAAGLIDKNRTLTYEFRIPFTLNTFTYSKGSKLYYNIKLSAKPTLPQRPANVQVVSATTVSMSSTYLFVPTDFWGEYLVY